MTPLQSTTLDFVRSFIAANGFSPSFSEIQDHLGVGSRSRVHELVHALADSGRIRVRPKRQRSIELIERPGDQLVAAARVVVAKHAQGRLQPAHVDDLRHALDRLEARL